MDKARCCLLVIDVQARLIPAIDGGDEVIASCRRLLDGAALMGVEAAFTEQNPAGLGSTVIGSGGAPVHEKMAFDACRDGGLAGLPRQRQVVVAGCEAHVCVLQTVLGLLEAGREVFVVQDAVGSRRAESKAAALNRMERHGAELVTVEMVLFEWLGTARHEHFREVVQLIK